MRNQSKDGNKPSRPSSVDKAGGKQGMPKPGAKKQEVRGSKPAPTARGANKPAPRGESRKNEAGSRPVAAKPVAEKKPVRGATKPTRPTPPNAPAKTPQTTTPTPTPAPNRLGSATMGLGNPNVGSRTGGIGASRTVGIGGAQKPRTRGRAF